MTATINRLALLALAFGLAALAIAVVPRIGQADGDGNEDTRVLRWHQSDDGERVYVLFRSDVDWRMFLTDTAIATGVTLQPQQAGEGNSDNVEGLRVAGLKAEHPLATIGLQRNDVLIRMNDARLVNRRVIATTFSAEPRPDEIVLTFRRESVLHTRHVFCFYMPDASAGFDYTVKEGDTLAAIATRNYGRAEFAVEIMRANELADLDAIEVGQTLKLPGHEVLAPPAQETAPNRWLIPVDERDSVAADMAATIGDLALVDTKRPADATAAAGWPEGVTSGVRLSAPDSGQLAYQRGFRPGDVVVRVNGAPVNGLAALVTVWQAASTADFIDIELVRGDAPVRLVAAIMPVAEIDPATLQISPILRRPDAFGCKRLPAEDGDSELTVRWSLTGTFVRFLEAQRGALLQDIQAQPHWNPLTDAFEGVRLRYVEPYTLPRALGFATDDLLTSFRLLPDGEAQPLTAVFQLTDALKAATACEGLVLTVVRAVDGAARTFEWIATVEPEPDNGTTNVPDDDAETKALQARLDAAVAWLVDHHSAGDEQAGNWSPTTFIAAGRAAGRNNYEALSEEELHYGRSEFDVITTAVALLALMAAGHEPADQTREGAAITRALAWLVAQQLESGAFVDTALKPTFRANAQTIIATWALAEAVLDGADDACVRACRSAVSYLEASQLLAEGDDSPLGWSSSGDLTAAPDALATGLTAIALWPLTSGVQPPVIVPPSLAAGVENQFKALTMLVRDARRVVTGFSERGGVDDGSWLPDGNERRPTMDALSILARSVTGRRAHLLASVMTQAIALIQPDALPTSNDASPERRGTVEMLYWLTASMATRVTGPHVWRPWRAALLNGIGALQALPATGAIDHTQALTGSFAPVGAWGAYGARPYATAMGALCTALALGKRNLDAFDACATGGRK